MACGVASRRPQYNDTHNLLEPKVETVLLERPSANNAGQICGADGELRLSFKADLSVIGNFSDLACSVGCGVADRGRLFAADSAAAAWPVPHGRTCPARPAPHARTHGAPTPGPIAQACKDNQRRQRFRTARTALHNCPAVVLADPVASTYVGRCEGGAAAEGAAEGQGGEWLCYSSRMGHWKYEPFIARRFFLLGHLLKGPRPTIPSARPRAARPPCCAHRIGLLGRAHGAEAWVAGPVTVVPCAVQG